MPLEANIITRSGSGKENPILSFLRMTAVGGVTGVLPVEGEAENEGRFPPGGGDDIRLKRGGGVPLYTLSGLHEPPMPVCPFFAVGTTQRAPFFVSLEPTTHHPQKGEAISQ